MADARVTVVIGAVDTGKTTLVTALARAQAARGLRTAVVDADVGQSVVGPPTTIGLGDFGPAVIRLDEARVIGLFFVGSTTPAGHFLPIVVGVRRLLDRAIGLGYERVVVDTAGLVLGDAGAALQHSTIDLARPDVVVCVQRTDEAEHLVRAYGGHPRVVRLAAADARRRTQTERRQYRERALAAYFADARTVEIDVGRVVRGRVSPDADARGLVVGLDDATGDTLGIGRISAVDEVGGRLLVEATIPAREIAAVRVGRQKV